MKTMKWWASRGYLRRPKVSFLLETHNMSAETIAIIKCLRKRRDAEIIVMDDGSDHDHAKAILDEIDGVNEFLLHYNDLFVILTQNRAMSFARGEFMVKLQDDDEYTHPGWIDGALNLFEKHPDLAIIGGRGSLHLANKFDWTRPLPWRPVCPKFQFVPAVNEAPMWIRRSAFLELEGFDEEFAPQYWGEQEICFRAWLAGMSVGWYQSGAKICAKHTGARRRQKQPLQGECLVRNRRLFVEKFADKLERVNGLVRKRNQALTG